MPLDENEWPIGPDGLPSRDAVRVVLIDERARVLLVRGHDFNAPDRSWWFTVGGGIYPGEDKRRAIIRECQEETGIDLTGEELVGPVIYRDALMRFADRDRRQREHFFLARLAAAEVSDHGWTDSEREVLDEMRWMSLAEVRRRAGSEQFYPQALPDLLAGWLARGWDGQCVKINEYYKRAAGIAGGS